MNDSEYARRAYLELRHQVAAGSRKMPAWNDLQETERELLIRMFMLGAQFMANALTEDAKQQAG